MNNEQKTELVNTFLESLGTLCVFFAGYMIGLKTAFPLAFFLFVVGSFLVLAIQVVPKEEVSEE